MWTIETKDGNQARFTKPLIRQTIFHKLISIKNYLVGHRNQDSIIKEAAEKHYEAGQYRDAAACYIKLASIKAHFLDSGAKKVKNQKGRQKLVQSYIKDSIMFLNMASAISFKIDDYYRMVDCYLQIAGIYSRHCPDRTQEREFYMKAVRCLQNNLDLAGLGDLYFYCLDCKAAFNIYDKVGFSHAHPQAIASMIRNEGQAFYNEATTKCIMKALLCVLVGDYNKFMEILSYYCCEYRPFIENGAETFQPIIDALQNHCVRSYLNAVLEGSLASFISETNPKLRYLIKHNMLDDLEKQKKVPF